jgi:transcription initiation factor TFIIIB Brf1 subunit/transcription initiation factor TFIIB
MGISREYPECPKCKSGIMGARPEVNELTCSFCGCVFMFDVQVSEHKHSQTKYFYNTWPKPLSFTMSAQNYEIAQGQPAEASAT